MSYHCFIPYLNDIFYTFKILDSIFLLNLALLCTSSMNFLLTFPFDCWIPALWNVFHYLSLVTFSLNHLSLAHANYSLRNMLLSLLFSSGWFLILLDRYFSASMLFPQEILLSSSKFLLCAPSTGPHKTSYFSWHSIHHIPYSKCLFKCVFSSLCCKL